MERIEKIALEGINRAGKGEQIKLLSGIFQALQIAYLVIRGDGTRPGLGESEGDPYSKEWQQRGAYLRKVGTTEDWNKASGLLAQEFATHVKAGKKEIIVLDRSLISRANFIIDKTGKKGTLSFNDLYPDLDTNFDFDSITPDVLFELKAPKEVILQRLDANDRKYEFRKRLIEETYEVYYQAKHQLPEVVKEKIVGIDAQKSISEVNKDVRKHIQILGSREG